MCPLFSATAAAHAVKTTVKDSLGLGLCVCDLSDKDGVLRVVDVAFLVHVGGGDGQQGAVVVEGQGCDAGRVTVELTQTLLIEGVPDVYEAVRAACNKDKTRLTFDENQSREPQSPPTERPCGGQQGTGL